MKHLERAFTGRNGFGWYILIIIISLVIQALAMIPIFGVITFLHLSGGGDATALSLDPMALLKTIDSNIALLALLIPMAISLLTILVLIKVIHKRSFAEVVNGTKKTRWQRVGFGFGIWFAMMALTTLGQYIISPESFTLQFNLSQFIPLFFITLIFMPMQTTFEEVMTRGYLAQGIGSLTKSRLLALLVPAALFALLHIANPEIGEYGLGVMLASYFAMALILGISAILDDGIELALGVHAANNMFISLFTTQKGAVFETAAVFEVAKGNPYIELVTLMIAGALVIAIFYKKYNWQWTTFNKKVEKPLDINKSID